MLNIVFFLSLFPPQPFPKAEAIAMIAQDQEAFEKEHRFIQVGNINIK